jgi:squalene-hopene/tetraprenyl-beta-curcumene cyclase
VTAEGEGRKAKGERLSAALQTATEALLTELTPDGHWVGELSSSALSTATAIVALGAVDRERNADLIAGGRRWLVEHQNADGGWGDTVKSKSNISTTALCWAALGGKDERSTAWLARAAGSIDELVPAIERRYGKDRTFSVPILMHLAICGLVDWRRIPALPFELAALPHQLFGALQLPVVSYALPALIAIGQAIHHHAPSRNPLARGVRELAREKTLRVLQSIQPENGGFLEATPLTSFVTMALASAGNGDHPVARQGVEFLRASGQADGSWAIDTNLATWVTTLAIKALAHQPGALTPEQKLTLRAWLLGQQYRVEHPYTHAAPGGWAWTNLPGGVPDADDTPGALLALLELGIVDPPTRLAGQMGVRWLLDLQNRDGGIPTFCRGWGALPFDRSSPDLTAHTLRAWSAWLPQLDSALAARTRRGITRGLAFLEERQRDDGSWLPLWFGNEHAPDDENPLYGTAHVILALRELGDRAFTLPAHLLPRAQRWLVDRQDASGGWSGAPGGPTSTEETALALEALAGTEHVGAVERGTAWLLARIEADAWREPAPIGFYFAKLWYYERLYPQVWTVGALGRVAALG